MMTKGVVVSAIIAVILSGCSVMNKTGIQTAPADFIIEQDTTDVVFEIGKLYNYDHQVIFKRNQYSLAESEKARLLDWLQATQPSMIGVRGTGGAQRHRDLGYKRASEIIGYLQSRQAGVDAVLLDYDATLLGGQGLLTVIPAALAEKIKAKAPILIISSK